MPTNFNLNNSVFSVSDISDSIKKLVEQNFSSIKIKGEISKPSFPASGHIYFNLKDENSAQVNLEEYEDGISPGQACVFYSKDEVGDKVLGGGWIDKTFNKNYPLS